MAKKDLNTGINRDRGSREETSFAPAEKKPEKKQTGKTQVKNAHAAGLGAIGRNDQKQQDDGEGIAY